jgi:hypothetical protein
MAYSIALNSTNVVGMGNNTYKYNFLNGFTVPEDSTISISQVTVPYSWFNITKSLGNNTFQYIMPTTGATSVTRTITLTDGFYDINALNQALWADLKSQNYYFYNSTISTITPSTGSTTFPTLLYPISFSSNYNGYNNAITFQFIPTSLGNTVTQYGTNWLWALGTFPTVSTAPQIVITGTPAFNTTLFGNIIGFQGGTFPSVLQTIVSPPTVANSAPYVVLGNSLSASPPFPALATPVNTVCVRCNLVDNSVAMPSDLMDFFPISSTFGSNIYYLPIADNAVKMRSGKHQSLTVTLCDQNFNPLISLDPNVLISILINFPEKKHIPAGFDRGKQIQKGLI